MNVVLDLELVKFVQGTYLEAYSIRLNVSIDSILCSTDNYLALSPSMGNGLQIWMHRDTSSGAPLPVKHVVLLIIAPMSISKNP